MPIKPEGPRRFVLDVFVGANDNPTGRRLRVRKRVDGCSRDEAIKLYDEIAQHLRATGYLPESVVRTLEARSVKPQRETIGRSDTPQALPAAPVVIPRAADLKRTLLKALEIAYQDPEEGWAKQRDGTSSYNVARRAVSIVGPHTACASVTRQHFLDLRAQLTAKGLSPASIARHLQALYRVLYFAEREGWITQRPKYKRPTISNRRMFIFSRELEAAAIAHFAATGENTMCSLFIVAIEAGFRLGELLKMEGRNVDLRAGMAFVPHYDAKNGEGRHVVLTPKAIAQLQERKQQYGDGRLFPDMHQPRVSSLMVELRSALGMPDESEMVFHATRHTCGSRMAVRGVPLAVMMEQLGHKQAEMTLRYIKTAAVERKNVILELMAGSQPADKA